MVSYNHTRVETRMRRSEMDIHNLCDLFAKELSDRTLYMCDEINSWHDALVRQIDDHVRDQRRLLEQEYKKQQNYIEDTRQQFIDATRPLEQSGNNERIDQLIAQCKALKFELAALQFPERTIPFIEFMTEEKLARKKRDEKKTDRTEDNKPRSNVGGGYGYYNTNSKDAHRISPSKLMSGHMEHIKQPSNTIKSANKNALSSNSNDNRYSNAGSGNISTDECPVCSMFFPSHMKRSEQATHVNAHFQES